MIKFIFFIIILVIILEIINNKSIENFGYPIWNIGTRHYPPYDIRGFWFNMHQQFYISPLWYTAGGHYIYDNELKKQLRK